MRLYTNEKQWPGEGTVLALGTFDGVHIGHRHLIREALVIARAEKIDAVAYTYSTHPASVFSPGHIPPLLETPEEKVRSLALAGADAAVLRPFTRTYASLPPEEFLRMISGSLYPRHIVVGYNYSFGEKGRGRAEDLKRLGDKYGFRAHIVEEVSLDGQTVSSTRIRGQVLDGDARDAARFLGRMYSLTGRIERGRRIGGQIGFPTANLAYPPGKVIPKAGVYAGWVQVCGKVYPAAINFGSQPTISGTPRIEAHLFGYSGGDLYGHVMRVELAERIREERRFASLDELKRKIAEDCECARGILLP